MADVPPVPTEHAPSVAIAEVVDASETNAFDDIHKIMTPLPPTGKLSMVRPAKAIELTETAIGNVVNELVENAIGTALVKAPETATRTVAGTALVETVDPVAALARELDLRASERSKNEKRALLVAQRKKVKIAVKKALQYCVQSGDLRRVSFANINSKHLCAMAVQLAPLFLEMKTPSTITEDFLASLINRLLDKQVDASSPKAKKKSQQVAASSPKAKKKSLSRVILTTKEIWGVLNPSTGFPIEDCLKSLPYYGDMMNSFIEEFSDGAIHRGKVKTMNATKGTFTVQWCVGGMTTKMSTKTFEKSHIRLAKDQAPNGFGNDTILGWMFTKNVAVYTPTIDWTLLNINEFPRKQSLPMADVYDNPANVDHLFTIEKKDEDKADALKPGEVLEFYAGDSLLTKRDIPEATDTGLEFGGVVCGEEHDVGCPGNDSQLSIQAGNLFMMHSKNVNGAPSDKILPLEINQTVAYHMLKQDGKVVRSSRVLAHPDKNARLDMKKNPCQASISTLNKSCKVITVCQTQNIQMVIHRVSNKPLSQRTFYENETPFVALAKVEYNCKDGYKKEIRDIYVDEFVEDATNMAMHVKRMMRGMQSTPAGVYNWSHLPEMKLTSCVGNLAAKVNDLTVRVKYLGMDETGLQRKWHVSELPPLDDSLWQEQDCAIENVVAITSAAQFMHADQQWLLMIPWAPFLAKVDIYKGTQRGKAKERAGLGTLSLAYGFATYWKEWGAVRRNHHGEQYVNPSKDSKGCKQPKGNKQPSTTGVKRPAPSSTRPQRVTSKPKKSDGDLDDQVVTVTGAKRTAPSTDDQVVTLPGLKRTAPSPCLGFERMMTLPPRDELLHHYIELHALDVLDRGHVIQYSAPTFRVLWDKGMESTLNVNDYHVRMHADQETTLGCALGRNMGRKRSKNTK